MLVLKIIGIIILVIIVAICVLTYFCFDDNDPDMDWYNSQN